MADSKDPQDLQVVSPTETPAETPAETPTPEVKAPESPPEDRILSVEETENLLRGFPTEGPEKDNGEDPEQAKMAQDFFAQIPQEPGKPTAEPAKPTPLQAAQAEALQQAQGLEKASAEPQVPAQAVPVQQQPSAQEAALQAQNALLSQQLQALQQRVEAMSAPAAAPAPAPPTPETFDFKVPDTYIAGLAAEDANVRKVALNQLLNGVAQAVMQRTQSMVEKRFESVPEIVQQHTTQAQQQAAIASDLYSTYPELSNMKELVAATAQQVVAETGMQDWSPMLRDEIARRLSPMAPAIFQRVQQNIASRSPTPPQLPQAQGASQIPATYAAVQGAPAAKPQAAPPLLVRDGAGNIVSVPQHPQQFQVPSGTRQGAGVKVNPEIQDIWRTLDF